MSISAHIEGRANVMFAEEKGLTLYTGDVSDLERKELIDNFEEKARYVRTPAGVRRFHKPIGSIIGGGGKLLPNISIEEPVFEGWDLVKGKNGKKYDVGKDGGKWAAYGHNDWDDLVATGKTQDEVLSALNNHVGGKGAGKARAPQAQKKPHAKRLSSASELDKLRDGAWIQGDDEESTYRKEGGNWVRYGVTVQGTVEEDGRWPSSDLADGEESYEVTRPIPGAPKYTPKKRSNESSRRPKGSVTEASSADVEPRGVGVGKTESDARKAQVEELRASGHTGKTTKETSFYEAPMPSPLGRVLRDDVFDVYSERRVGYTKNKDGGLHAVRSAPFYGIGTDGKTFFVVPEKDGSYSLNLDGKLVRSYKKGQLKSVLSDIRGGSAPSSRTKTPTAKQTPEPKDPSYRRGADRLRRVGIEDFHPNQARQVDEMTRDQWEEAQLEVDAGASISEVLAKRAVAQRGKTPSKKISGSKAKSGSGASVIDELSSSQKRQYQGLDKDDQRRYLDLRNGKNGRALSHAAAMKKIEEGRAPGKAQGALF